VNESAKIRKLLRCGGGGSGGNSGKVSTAELILGWPVSVAAAVAAGGEGVGDCGGGAGV